MCLPGLASVGRKRAEMKQGLSRVRKRDSQKGRTGLDGVLLKGEKGSCHLGLTLRIRVNVRMLCGAAVA